MERGRKIGVGSFHRALILNFKFCLVMCMREAQDRITDERRKWRRRER